VLEAIEGWLKRLLDGENERAQGGDVAAVFAAQVKGALQQRLRLNGADDVPPDVVANIQTLERRLRDVHEADLAYAEVAQMVDCSEMDRLFDLRANSADHLKCQLSLLRQSILSQSWRPAPRVERDAGHALDLPGQLRAHGNPPSTGTLADAGPASHRGARDVASHHVGNLSMPAVRMKQEPRAFAGGWEADLDHDEENVCAAFREIAPCGSADAGDSSGPCPWQPEAADLNAPGIEDPYACLFSDEVDL